MAPVQAGRFLLLEKLAESSPGDGLLCRALWREGGVERTVAVKRRARLDGQAFLRRDLPFGHVNLVQPLETDVGDRAAWMASELIDGVSVDQLLRAEVALPIQEALWIVSEAARGLAYLHGLGATAADRVAGLAHRRLSARKVLISVAGEVKVAGLALLPRGGFEGLRRAGLAPQAGTPRTEAGPGSPASRFLAPEQRRGEPGDASADVYALGAILADLTQAHNTDEPLAAAVAAIVRRATASRRDVRYHGAAAMRADLLRLVDERAPLRARLANRIQAFLPLHEPDELPDRLPGELARDLAGELARELGGEDSLAPFARTTPPRLVESTAAAGDSAAHATLPGEEPGNGRGAIGVVTPTSRDPSRAAAPSEGRARRRGPARRWAAAVLVMTAPVAATLGVAWAVGWRSPVTSPSASASTASRITAASRAKAIAPAPPLPNAPAPARAVDGNRLRYTVLAVARDGASASLMLDLRIDNPDPARARVPPLDGARLDGMGAPPRLSADVDSLPGGAWRTVRLRFSLAPASPAPSRLQIDGSSSVLLPLPGAAGRPPEDERH